MAVTGTSGLAGLTTTSSSSASGSKDSQEIAGNFQDFLKLLTTQLKNQSPLDPLDTNQFTQQLVQFASVEQQLKTNATLTTLATGAKASTASSAAGLVGSKVTADGSSSSLSGGSAVWTLNAGKASTATATIRDSTGVTVATRTLSLSTGDQTFTWDGRTTTGTVASTGTYTIAVTARDAAGQPVTVTSDVTGTVSSVDMSGDAPVLLIGQQRVPLSGIKSIGG